MQDHRSKLEVKGIGTWTLNSPSGEAEFIGDSTYLPVVRSTIWKFFKGGSKPKFIDPQRRFVLLDAVDEILLGDATGELKTVAVLNRIWDDGMRRSAFVSAPVPVFIFERGLVVFDSDGHLRWSRNDLKLNDFFKQVENQKVLYHSEHRGDWAYDLSTGDSIPIT